MATDWIGQSITFAAEIDPDANYNRFIWIRAQGTKDTVKAIAARRGHPEMATDILALNKGRDVLVHPKPQRVHSNKSPGKGWVGVGGGWWQKQTGPVPRLSTVTQILRQNVAMMLPGIMSPGETLSVHAGNEPPIVKKGYANYDTVTVPGRVGINRFLGYDPIEMDIAVQFENYRDQVGSVIETNIQTLERFAGRGDYPGAGFGPPAVIRVSVTDNVGNIVPLLPPDYQWSAQHTQAPLFRISNIAWDQGALRNDNGYRIRQGATITIKQYTPLVFVVRSVAQRTALINPKKK